MTIDDIYSAAINGEKEKLIQLLETGEVDINQTVYGGVHNGVHTSFTVLFSIVAQMRQTGFDFEILDILVKYGIDLNAPVEVYNDAFTRKIPIAAYAIRDWDTPQLVGYLLSRGANPSNAQIEINSDGRKELYPLSYLAIVFRKDHHLLNLLLRHGADPNMKVFTYNHEQACPQILPQLFYAIVNQDSLEKAAALFSYGADPNIECMIGYGRVRNLGFADYIRKVYPKMLDLFNRAYRQGSSNRMTPTRISVDKFRLKKAAPQQEVQQTVQAEKQQPETQQADPLQPLRDCAEELIMFDLKRKKSYHQALEASKIQPGLFGKGKKEQQEAQAVVDAVNAERAALVKKLNTLDRQHTGGKIPRWWNQLDGLNFFTVLPQEVLIWMPAERLTEGPDGLTTVPICTDADDRITEAEVKLLQKAGVIRPIYVGKPDPEGQYHIAELCLWSIQDAAWVRQEQVDSFTEKEIRDAVRSRDEDFNKGEQFLNLLQNKGSFTNEELHLAGQMSTGDFFNSQFLRERHIRNYQERLRNAKTVKTSIENRTLYRQYFRPVGIILFDEKIENISYIMIYEQERPGEGYLMDANKVIHEIKKYTPGGTPEGNRISAIRNLMDYPIPQADILAPKPEYLSDQEWYNFVYFCHRTFGLEALNIRVTDAYKNAKEHKQAVIQSTRW